MSDTRNKKEYRGPHLAPSTEPTLRDPTKCFEHALSFGTKGRGRLRSFPRVYPNTRDLVFVSAVTDVVSRFRPAYELASIEDYPALERLLGREIETFEEKLRRKMAVRFPDQKRHLELRIHHLNILER